MKKTYMHAFTIKIPITVYFECAAKDRASALKIARKEALKEHESAYRAEFKEVYSRENFSEYKARVDSLGMHAALLKNKAMLLRIAKAEQIEALKALITRAQAELDSITKGEGNDPNE